MSETGQILLGLCILIMVYALTRKFNAWRIKSAYEFILKDLERKGAFDPSSAVELPYAKMGLFSMGTKDFRPKALQFLIASNMVGETDAGRYYIKDKKMSLPKSE